MRDHEYSIVGHSRARIGLYIALISGMIASFATFAIGKMLQIAEDFGHFDVPEILILPLTVTSIFGVLFFLFSKHGWKVWGLRQVIGVPDLSGCWTLSGQTYDADQRPTYAWHGQIDITQDYERISIHLRTETSGSHSLSAAIIPEGRVGFSLIYSYQNDPKPGERELSGHKGHCELLFDRKFESAEGNYFNGGGRFTHGIMKLERNLEDG